MSILATFLSLVNKAMFSSTKSNACSRDEVLERARKEREARNDDKRKHASAAVIQVVVFCLFFLESLLIVNFVV